jgi:hypothetical protein
MKINIITLITLLFYSISCKSKEENWMLDSRFAKLDIKTMIEKEYPNLHSISETISHYSGYYNLNPFLLAELVNDNKTLDVIDKANELSKSLSNNKLSNKLNSKQKNKINQLMSKYLDSEDKSLKGTDELPAFDLPFDYPSGWVFNGVHTWTGEDDGSPMSSIDLTRSWMQSWGSFTDIDWVSAAHDGIVTVFSSCYVRVTHDSGWATDYYHLDNVQLNTGDHVLAGDHLANYANNLAQAICQGGNSSGPHLHFSLLKDGVRRNLQDIELSRWKIKSGNYSYDSSPANMWLIKNNQKAYARQHRVTHLAGDNIIDYRYSGIYSNSQISGHGVNILLTNLNVDGTDSIRNIVFITFYTYDDNGNSNFYAGNVDFDSWRIDTTKTVGMIQTSGGNFQDLMPINFETDVLDAGVVEVKFNNCSEVEVYFNLIEPSTGEYVSNHLVLSKTIGLPDVVCNSASQVSN